MDIKNFGLNILTVLKFPFSFLPIYWRYLLSHYLRVLFLCVAAFVAVLLTTRLDEIAHFATLGPEGIYILLFTLHQIPYILPIAIPIACLISSILLIQKLSRFHELTALRAAGMSLGGILFPLLLAAALLSAGTFYIVSELSTKSHLTTSLLKTELRSINPLLLLHNKHLMKLKGMFFQTLGDSKLGESAEEVIIAMPNKHNNRINLLLADKLKASSKKFVGQGITLITSLNKENESSDHYIVENMEEAKTTIRDFTQMMQKKVWTLNNDHLRMPLLLIKLEEEKALLSQARIDNQSPQIQKVKERCVAKCYSEILRRFSVGFAAFSFTLMGCAFGINISRNPSHFGLTVVIGLAAFYLIAYFVAKGIDDQLLASGTLYLFPHLLILVASAWSLRRATHGIE